MMQFDEAHNVSPTMQHSPAILRKGVLHFVDFVFDELW